MLYSCIIEIFITEHVTQDSTTTTHDDTLLTDMLPTIILIAVDGGAGEDVVV